MNNALNSNRLAYAKSVHLFLLLLNGKQIICVIYGIAIHQRERKFKKMCHPTNKVMAQKYISQ